MSIEGQTILIVGGTSGLGLKFANALKASNRVIITGRTDPKVEGVAFEYLELCCADFTRNLDHLAEKLPKIDILVYSAGHYARGPLIDMSDEQVMRMNILYLVTPMLLIPRITRKQGYLPGLIGISSISQYKPKETEPVYCSLKAGFGMLCHCLSFDLLIGKVLVAAPARINKTGTGGACEGELGKLDADWVLNKIISEYEGRFFYKLIGFRRDPAKFEVIDVRTNKAERRKS